ncbi:MAG: ammonium transporter [Paludibacteraceae bacterium]|nr:ammonium transporter [Paludibacteraceae bacterium]MEE3485516.1 ammonium transporter [Bacteroidales bacterium]
MKKRWIIFMLCMVLIVLIAWFIPSQPEIWTLSDNVSKTDIAWMLTATIFVLMMTPGLSFFYGGMVRKKNIISTILQSIIAMGIISVVWVICGFSLSFGEDVLGIIGNPTTYFFMENVGGQSTDTLSQELGLTIPLALYALFQMKFAIITPSLTTGSFAERVHFSGYLVFMVLFCIFIYCPLAHCTWHPDGLFNQMHVKDFAGGIVVHASSGIAALIGAIYLGKRRNQTTDPANIPYVVLGAVLLWLGWFGFNAGSSLSADSVAVKAFLNTNTAAATAMITWIFFDCVRGRKPSAMGASIGSVVGLVAITPSAGWVSTSESIVIAFITTIICNMACYIKNKKTAIDDALDVFPTHGLGGIVGTLLTGIFVYKYEPELAEEGVTHFQFFINHLIAIAIVFAYTAAMSYALFWITNKMITIRVSEESEKIGLDMSQHNEHYGRLREIAEYDDRTFTPHNE